MPCILALIVGFLILIGGFGSRISISFGLPGITITGSLGAVLIAYGAIGIC